MQRLHSAAHHHNLSQQCRLEEEEEEKEPVLQRLASGGSDHPIMVKQDTPLPGESPIYYVQLPSSPYYYADNSALATVPLPPHTKASTRTVHHTPPSNTKKVDIDFAINGKPGKVYHYSSPITKLHYPPLPPHHLPLPSTSPPPPPSSPLPPLPSTTITPAPTGFSSSDPTPDKRLKHSKVVLRKKFSFNGKPMKVYVWRGSSPLTIKNHRRARRPFRF
ncbi:hypothetical protein E2C01_072520 [Portunus trituberculatus]|uniref:Uncharacterized protein n=1 Tax=Portunus trituberculatus TaxID=210409 RepID=A0A5B7I962_PORTR|nr:hypothetical protein [Portunus trituberculatus]